MVAISKNNGEVVNSRVGKIFVNEGIIRKEVKEARCGEIAIVQTISDISIGDTICDINHINPLPPIIIEEPTMSMNFLVNSSPFAGRSGKFLTNRHIKERLDRELETNVGLKVESLNGADGYKVSGRGELHLSVLLEEMRREGYELSVSKPVVLFKEIDGVKCEPFEEVLKTIDDENLVESVKVKVSKKLSRSEETVPSFPIHLISSLSAVIIGVDEVQTVILGSDPVLGE